MDSKVLGITLFPIEYHTRGRAIFHLGFGYDHVNDEYKVLNRIRFSDLCDRDQSSWYDEVYIYSSKQNSWRRMKHFPFKLSNYHYYCALDCVLADGALHWFMRERRLNGVIYIISFDLSNEEFQKMPCPMIPWPLGYFQHNLKVLNGSLCLILYYDVGGGFGADIWVMEDYGVEKSWTKLTSVTMPGWTFWSLTPLALSKNKRQLLLQIDGVKLVLHDLEAKRISDLATRGDLKFCC
ncbi:F-box protein CPR1-like [Coffea arabica]|uniref:F-box protein CPR1-like n=1 Tax=Coffea arabica TaxID=13443 RepID=A0A6P6V7Y5_COFAR|nr:F-box protein CPR1-like [Coffea arabica]